MKKHHGYELTPEDETDIELALAKDIGPQPNDAVAVRCSKSADTFLLTLRRGLVLQIPKNLIHELDDLPSGSSTLGHVGIFGAGFAVAWDDIDVAIKTADLIAHVLSPGLTASQIGKRGGAVKSDRKTVSSRRNGRKGGRPQKNAA